MSETLDNIQDNIVAEETKKAAEAGVITTEQATKEGIAAIEKALAAGKAAPQNQLMKIDEQNNKQSLISCIRLTWRSYWRSLSWTRRP